jgi:serine/threonine-protein phosphatase 2A regulatory subunit B''
MILSRVQNEIFDMVCPAVDGRITLADLISSRCGHTVISILIDVNGFWKYDNRETLMHNEEEEN